MNKLAFQVNSIFQDHMILQREKKIVVWGTGEPGRTVEVCIQGQQSSGRIGENGYWEVFLSELKASVGETLEVACDQEKKIFSDVAVGEVWLAGGQSNMEFHLCFEKHWEEESVRPINENLRFYDVPSVAYPGQETDFDYSRVGVWRKATPADLKYFSAVGYYFQKQLQMDLDIPVGIVGCNWGGTTASAWMKRESVEKLGNYWWEKFLSASEGIDWDEYYLQQKDIPVNDRGNETENEFSKVFMPKVYSLEEAFRLLEQMPVYDYTYLFPERIPGSLYEHMVKKAAPFAIRGILWYQGESDDEAPDRSIYEAMLTTLIEDWRGLWNDNTLPFLIVQLPSWDRWIVGENVAYHVIRSCQEAVTRKVHDTYLCSISDAGEQYDIHPKDKKVVGYRLALLAEGHIYGKEILCDAPCLKEARRAGTRCYLSFAHAEGGLIVDGDFVNSLQIIQDGDALEYSFSVEGDTLVIDFIGKADCVSIHFADAKWYRVNLYNRMKIPAIPFTVCI